MKELIDITDMKAHAYDCLASIEALQRELQKTNQRIAELSKVANGSDNVIPLKNDSNGAEAPSPQAEAQSA